MDRVLFSLGSTPVTAEMALYGGAALFAVLLGALAVMAVRANRQRAEEAQERAAAQAQAETRAREAERHLAELMQPQA